MRELVYYLQTQDPSRVVRITSGRIHLVPDPLPPASFNLTNILTHQTMTGVRQVLRQSGLRLYQPGIMAVRLEASC